MFIWLWEVIGRFGDSVTRPLLDCFAPFFSGSFFFTSKTESKVNKCSYPYDATIIVTVHIN